MTTSVKNKKILRNWLKALQSGDIEKIESLQSVDCVWILPGTKKLAWAGRWKGVARHKLFIKKIRETVDFNNGGMQFQEYICEGSRATVIGQEIARSVPKGKRWNVTFAWVFKFKRGKVVQWEAFENTEIIASCY